MSSSDAVSKKTSLCAKIPKDHKAVVKTGRGSVKSKGKLKYPLKLFNTKEPNQ